MPDDVAAAKTIISSFPRVWEGRKCVLEMKEANYNWRQMEWWAFYWELLFKQARQTHFAIPGDRIHNVRLDMKGMLNWDLKTKAINTDSFDVILNDVSAVEAVVDRDGAYGAIIGLCEVEYNDESRSFQKWRDALQGKPSNYVMKNRQRGALSRLRKTRAELVEVLFVVLKKSTLGMCKMMHQGKNSNERPRPPKYMLDLQANNIPIIDRMTFYRSAR